MAVNFPNNPSDQDTFVSSGRTFRFNGTSSVWEVVPGTTGTDVSDLTDTTNVIPADVSDLTDTTNVIPADVSDLTDTGGLLGSGGATVYADMAALIAATGMSNGDLGLVSANNNVYIYNGSGWYKIATVQNDSPSAITGVDGTYELTTDATPTVITAVSTDPEGFPLTWTYATSGLGSIATISQSDNVFTITPSTTVTDAGTFTLTINATDGVNGAVSANTNLTLEFIVIVTNSKYTTLLATAVDTSDNNNITDSSSNTHSITANGDAYAGTFSPYRHGGYSTYFDGTGDFLEGPAENLLGSGAFTVECWAYISSTNSNYTDAFLAQYESHKRFIFGVKSNVVRVWMMENEVFVGTTNITGGWHHIALVRDSNNNCQVYIDGNAEGSSFSNSTDFSVWLEDFEIGSWDNGVNSSLDGYISDLRVVKGTAITPPSGGPTERLEAVTNTSLLTCHLPYISDGSTNNHSITVNANVSTKPFSPYDNLEYAAADHGGSVYFDGSGDSLTVYDATSAYANPSGLNLRDSAFTLEFWFYLNGNTSGLHTFFNTYSGSVLSDPNETLKLTIRGSDNLIALYDKVAGANILDTNKHIPQQTWNHFCWTRDASNNHVFYLNGEQIGTSTFTTYLTNNTWVFGTRAYNNTQNLTGYMSDFSLIKGSVTRTSAFTPPTAPLSSSGTELHIKGTDASIIDKSQNSNLSLHGNTTGSTTQVKFADTKSMYFDGSGDYIDLERYVDIAGDFTFEAWVKPSTAWSGAVGTLGGDTDSGAGSVMRMNGSGSLSVYSNHPSNGGTIININGTFNPFTSTSNLNGATLTDYAWTHLALSRTGSTVYLYVNGIRNAQTGSGTGNLYFDVIGGQYSGGSLSNPFSGYIQDLRVSTKALYTASDETSNIPTEPLKG